MPAVPAPPALLRGVCSCGALVRRAFGRRLLVVAVPALAALADPAPAAAQTATVRAYGTASVAYSDNVLNAPDDPVTGVDPARYQDVFLLFNPGVVLQYESGRTRLALSYEQPVALYFINEAASVPPNYGSANTSSNLAAFTGNFALSRRDEMIVVLRASQLTTRQITLSSPELTGVGTQLDSDNTVLTVALTQNLAHQFAGRWRGTQAFATTMVQPLFDETQSTRWFANLQIGAEYLAGLNMVSAELGHTYVHTSVLSPNIDGDSSDQLLNTLNLRWRRDLSLDWSMELGAGLTSAYAPAAAGFYIGPMANARVGWARDGFAANLQYARGLVPNPLAGPTALSDSLQLSGGIPLFVPGLSLVGSAGGSYNQVLGADASVGGSAVSLVSDAALSFTPAGLPSFSLRYQHVQQIQIGEGTAALRPFHVNQATFAIGYSFPQADRRTVVTPYRSQRVDGTDVAPLGGGGPAPSDPGPNRGLQ